MLMETEAGESIRNAAKANMGRSMRNNNSIRDSTRSLVSRAKKRGWNSYEDVATKGAVTETWVTLKDTCKCLGSPIEL